ncbi:protease HtpX [bacterium]|nr:protease HtpX [bacterium]
MTFLKRFGYFIITGILVALTVQLVVGFVARFFGINLYSMSGGYAGLFVLCLIWGFVGSFISLQLSRWMAKRFHGVEVIDPNTHNQTERKLIDMVYRIARSAGMDTMPEVGYYQSADVNAFATGPSKSRSLVAVSSGLMNSMNDAEIEGVLAHEIAHIVNGDMVTLTLIQGIVNAFAMFFAQIITMAVMNAIRGKDDDRRGFGDFMLRQMIYTAVSIVFTLLGSIVVNYFSRQREFRADAGGARFSSQEKMTAALMKLQRVYELPQAKSEDDEEGQDKLMAFKISGKSKGAMSALFMTHPPLEERIAALRNRTYSQSI